MFLHSGSIQGNPVPHSDKGADSAMDFANPKIQDLQKKWISEEPVVEQV